MFDSIGLTLLGITTPDQIEPGSDGNERVHCIPQSFKITGASPSDCLMSYLGDSLGDFYLSAEFSTAPVTVGKTKIDCTMLFGFGFTDFFLLYQFFDTHRCRKLRQSCYSPIYIRVSLSLSLSLSLYIYIYIY